MANDDPICQKDLGHSWCKMPKSWAGHTAPGIPDSSRPGRELDAFIFHEFVEERQWDINDPTTDVVLLFRIQPEKLRDFLVQLEKDTYISYEMPHVC